MLLANQSEDQHTFFPGVRIEDALLTAEKIIASSLEFNVPIWLISMDMRKAFDIIDHNALFNALRNHGVQESYLQLLHVLYQDQLGSVNGSSTFQIQRGVKQGDTLSAILFNCALDMAFEA